MMPQALDRWGDLLTGVRFADPWVLWVVGPAVLLWSLVRGLQIWRPSLWQRMIEGAGAGSRRWRPAALVYPSLGLVRETEEGRRLLLRKVVLTLRLVTLALLCLALARPLTGRAQTQMRSQGVDIVLALDASRSMAALDMDSDRPVPERRNRLEAAKAVVEEFIAARPRDQMGLVVFGDQAFTRCPLTLDHSLLAGLLEEVELGMAGEGTALGTALGTAVRRLRQSPARSKVIVLLTDGQNTTGVLSPAKAAEVAATFGIRVYTIGVGGRGPALIPVETTLGPQLQQRQIELDEETLQDIAGRTGGSYRRAEDLESLRAIYRRIDRLETSEITTRTFLEHEEGFAPLVAGALALLLLEVVLLGSRFRSVP